ncbi:MAG: carbamate kinase [Prevotella sp.]|nr:carbamate kinase [Prevotella sp.]MBR6494136.1 carbamate kinase [Prevotella sp.]
MKKRLVIALGGNALGKSPFEQLELVKKTASTIVDLVEEGYDVVIGHGNGPQVGMVNLAFEYSANNGSGTPLMPFPECGAMTQGYIGYHLQQAVGRELANRGVKRSVVSVVTQVVVDSKDKAFKNPTKPVGMFYFKEDAERMMKETGYTFIEDAGRGWRRVVPSPIPKKIVELPVVEQLVSKHHIVITVGGGGIPVVEKSAGAYEGVAAVIDKDRASALLALELKADMLVILTAVDRVSINYNKPNQFNLSQMTLSEAKKYIKQGHFAPGSMLPKVESCMSFVENTENGTALITSLERAREALRGETGTRIVKK